MKAFRRILCATDISRAWHPALDRAIALARRIQSTLSIAHVISRFVMPFGDGFVSPVTYEAIDRRAHEHAQSSWRHSSPGRGRPACGQRDAARRHAP